MILLVSNDELVRLPVDDVALTAALFIVLTFDVLAERCLQEPFHAGVFELLALLAAATGQTTEKLLVVLTAVLVTDVGLRLVSLLLLILGCQELGVAVTRVLMEALTSLVPIVIALLLDVFSEQALWGVPVVATAAPVLLLWHGSDKIFCLAESVLYGRSPDQALEEFLIEFESARLCDLISCVDSDDCWGWIDTLDQDFSEFL